jgi:hypothetical protein
LKELEEKAAELGKKRRSDERRQGGELHVDVKRIGIASFYLLCDFLRGVLCGTRGVMT